MIKPSDVILTIEQVANGDELIVTSISQTREYLDGKLGKVIGTKYHTVAPLKCYEQLIIKTDELKPSITQEMIDSSEEPIIATPLEFTAKFYKNYAKNEYLLTAKAVSMTLI